MKTNQLRSIVPIITMCVSIAGVMATAVLTAKATPTAMEKLQKLKDEKTEPTAMEVVKAIGPSYAPAVISGTLTIASIIGTTILNRRTQASLASAYAILNHNYQRYRGTVKKLFGEEADQKVVDELIKSECDPPKISAPGLISSTTLDFDVDEEKRLFYDAFSGRYFESTISSVLQAEYYLNRDYSLGRYLCANDFFKFLGLESTVDGDLYFWNPEDGIEWIDFEHQKVVLDSGLECLVIYFVWPPTKEDENEENYMAVR